MGNCFRKLISVCELGGVIKMRGIRCCYFCFFHEDIEKRGNYWLSNSYALVKFLHGGINMRSLLIAYVILKFVDSMGKAFGFF